MKDWHPLRVQVAVLSVHSVVEGEVEVIELVYLNGSGCLLVCVSSSVLVWARLGTMTSSLKVKSRVNCWSTVSICRLTSLPRFPLKPLQHRDYSVSVVVHLSVDVGVISVGVGRCKVWTHVIDLVYLGPELVDNHVLHDVNVAQPDLDLADIDVVPADHSKEVSLVLGAGGCKVWPHAIDFIYPGLEFVDNQVAVDVSPDGHSREVSLAILDDDLLLVDLGIEPVHHQTSLDVSVGEPCLAVVVTGVHLDHHSREANPGPLEGFIMVLYSTMDTVQYIGVQASPGLSF